MSGCTCPSSAAFGMRFHRHPCPRAGEIESRVPSTSEGEGNMSETTWRDVAAARPEVMQAYVQERGPLPDGPVTEESWKKFWAWLQART